MKTIAFFNNKGGVGKTSLVYHLAHMFADNGINVAAIDLDPQANLTAMCLTEVELDKFWGDDRKQTIYSAMQPLLDGVSDITSLEGERIRDRLTLVIGDLALSQAEDELSSQWTDCLDRKPRAFRVVSAMWRIIEQVANDNDAEIVLLDVGPNLGAINRAAMISAQHVVVPLAPDIYSLQGLKNLGPTLRLWRSQWDERYQRTPVADLSLPSGEMLPIGYVVLQHSLRDSRPVKAYKRWMDRIPQTYRTAVLNDNSPVGPDVTEDPQCLSMLKHSRSLMPLAMEANKPMFKLKPADGAIGAHVAAVQGCYQDFHRLAKKIAMAVGVEMQ